MKTLTDNFGRVHNYLRISLTDRCNLNCSYCNPLMLRTEYINKEEILSFEEIYRLIRIFSEFFNVKKVRFTGGEPLARKGFVPFLKGLKKLKNEFGFQTAITTNGVLLAEKLDDIINSGLDGINISLDSFIPDIFKNITGKNELHKVLLAIYRAKEMSLKNLKLNCVVMRGVNDNEILRFAEFAVKNDINVRFIEYMPFTNNGWNEGTFISSAQIKKIIEAKYILEECASSGSVSKDYWIKGNKGKISFISSISDHFCNTCSRLRITAKGSMRLCLFSGEKQELNLKNFLRDSSITNSDIAGIINEIVKTKQEKHASITDLVNMDYNYMLRNGG